MIVHNNRLGLRLKQYRKKQGWTQENAAEKFGLSLVYYGEIERGHKTPAIKTLLSFCEEMKCSLSDLAETRNDAYYQDNFTRETISEIAQINDIINSSTPTMITTYLEVIRALKDGFNHEK